MRSWWRPDVAAGVLALVLGALHLLLLPPTGTDLAAQLARASFARDHPLTPVDLSWYAGTHAYGYSLLAPYVMAVLGVPLAGLLAAVAGAVLLARLLLRTSHPWPGALAGAVFSVADVVSGRTTFALGAVAALGALLVLPRRWPAVALGVLTGLLSPVAAAFLGLAAAVLVLLRRPGGWPLGLAAAVPVGVLGVLFPSGGVQPYEVRSAPWAVVAGLVLALFTHSASLRLGGLLYALASAFLLLLSDPFGSNVLRLGLLLAAPLVLATTAVRWRYVLAVVAVLVWWQAQPPYADLRAKQPPPFDALNAALVDLDVKRVEVVPLRDHGEAAHVAPVVPLARGWSRQVDTDRNPLFYDGPLDAREYEHWVRDNGVDAVALARSARADRGGRAERALLLVGQLPWLERAWQDEDWTVWRVRDPQPLAGPPAVVVDTDRTRVVLRATGAGQVPLKVRWSRWLTVDGPACLERDGSAVRVNLRGPGQVVVSSALHLRPRGHC